METLKPEEFAKEMKVNKVTVFRWCDRNQLGHIRIGSVVRIPRKDADEFIQHHYRKRYLRAVK